MGRLKEQMKRDMKLKNFSPRTIETYLGCVKGFAVYYNRSPEELGALEIRDYLYHLLNDKKASQSAINQVYSALKFFYEKTLGVTWNRDRIPRSKAPKRLPLVLSKAEVVRIFEATKNLKHRAILMTIYSGGLRVSEASHLKLRDIDRDRMLIRVEQGKGKKDRYTLLGQRALEMLQMYWRVYRPDEWLFPSRRPEQPISISTIQRVFSKALKLSGIKKHASVHTLRHSFATHLLESGVDLYYIQRFLGHSTSRTTAVYLHVTRKDMGHILSPIDLPCFSDDAEE